jgi:CheY-like chemotaxis protein
MSKQGAILIVDDDLDDQELIKEICLLLKIENTIIFLHDSRKVLEHLINEKMPPFLILCDMNMPVLSGLELRKIINENPLLKQKAIPFVFFSTGARQNDINLAYSMTVQGYFEKGRDFAKLTRQFEVIFEYWKECKRPTCLTERY